MLQDKKSDKMIYLAIEIEKVKSAGKAIKLNPEQGDNIQNPLHSCDNIRLQFPAKLQRFYYFSNKKLNDHSEGQNVTKGVPQPKHPSRKLFAKERADTTVYQLTPDTTV